MFFVELEMCFFLAKRFTCRPLKSSAEEGGYFSIGVGDFCRTFQFCYFRLTFHYRSLSQLLCNLKKYPPWLHTLSGLLINHIEQIVPTRGFICLVAINAYFSVIILSF